MRSLLLGALVLSGALSAAAAPPPARPSSGPATTLPDSTSVAPRIGLVADAPKTPVSVEFSIQPAAFWSSSRGFGVAGSMTVRHAGWDDSEIKVGARLSQRFQSAAVSLYTHDPYTTPLYGLFSGQVRTSTRQRYYGLGPLTSRDDGLYLDFASGQLESRLGWYPLGHSGLLLQPGVRFLWDRLSGFEEEDPGAVERLMADGRSIESLQAVEGETRTGVSVGLEVGTDTRDRLVMTRRGLLAEGSIRRFFATDGSGLRFNSAQARVFGFYPVRGRRVVAFARAVAAVTRADDDPDGTALPFFYRPVLDDALLSGYVGERFFGRDLLAVGAGVRFPFLDLFGRYGIDAVLLADVGSSYDDITEQFSPSISFDTPVTADADGRVPLRPSVAFGFNLVNLDKTTGVAGVLVGFSPESLTITGLTIVYDFRDLRPLFR